MLERRGIFFSQLLTIIIFISLVLICPLITTFLLVKCKQYGSIRKTLGQRKTPHDGYRWRSFTNTVFFGQIPSSSAVGLCSPHKRTPPKMLVLSLPQALVRSFKGIELAIIGQNRDFFCRKRVYMCWLIMYQNFTGLAQLVISPNIGAKGGNTRTFITFSDDLLPLL